MKARTPASTHKKVVVELLDRKSLRGFLNPARMATAVTLDVLTPEGAHQELALDKVRAVYFVRDFEDAFELERTSFLSRPKLEGLWVRLKFRDGETLEGVIQNDLLGFLDNGVQLTPPDLSANTDKIFVPRTALEELTVLGVVGIARRKPAAPTAAQPRLFNE